MRRNGNKKSNPTFAQPRQPQNCTENKRRASSFPSPTFSHQGPAKRAGGRQLAGWRREVVQVGGPFGGLECTAEPGPTGKPPNKFRKGHATGGTQRNPNASGARGGRGPFPRDKERARAAPTHFVPPQNKKRNPRRINLLPSAIPGPFWRGAVAWHKGRRRRPRKKQQPRPPEKKHPQTVAQRFAHGSPDTPRPPAFSRPRPFVTVVGKGVRPQRRRSGGHCHSLGFFCPRFSTSNDPQTSCKQIFNFERVWRQEGFGCV